MFKNATKTKEKRNENFKIEKILYIGTNEEGSRLSLTPVHAEQVRVNKIDS